MALKKMKVAFDHQIFTFQSFGGISKYYYSLARGIKLSGHDPRIFAGLHQNEYLSERSEAFIKGFRIPIFGERGVTVRGRINSLYNRSMIPAWKPDVIHQTFQQSLGFHANVPVIMTVCDMIYELESNFDPAGMGVSSQEKRKAVSSVDHVICISENTKKDLIRLFGTSPEKISVVSLAADEPARNIPPFLNNGRPYLLVVGSRAGIKNFPRLLEALAQTDLLDYADLIAFGGGPFTEQEDDKMRACGIRQSSIKQLPGDDLMLTSLYKGARLFVYPSIYEGFGLPPLEAMAAGCPVASSNTSSMPEVLGNAALYFHPKDPSEMAEVLTRLFHDNSGRKAAIKAGLAQAALYSWERTAQQTLEVYERVLSERR